MKWAFCLMMIVMTGCNWHTDPTKNFLYDRMEKLAQFLNLDSHETTAFCLALLQTSPTREEYIRNWHPQDDSSSICPPNNEHLVTCTKEKTEAFNKGLACYQSAP